MSPYRQKKKHPELHWKAMAGMRDVLAHRYFGVDAEAVWQTVREDLPRAIRCVRKILSKNKTA